MRGWKLAGWRRKTACRGDTRATSNPFGVQRVRPGATVVAFASAVGLLLSSATLYLTYHPYWYILQRGILNGDRTQARDLRDFLLNAQMLPGVRPGSDLSLNLPVYFWTGVTLLGLIGLAFILLRHLLARPRPDDIQHIPRVP